MVQVGSFLLTKKALKMSRYKGERAASKFSIKDLKKHRSYDDRVNKKEEQRDIGRESIKRALKDALDISRIAPELSDEYHAEKSEEARRWIRNPNTGSISLTEACDMAQGSISVKTVQRALDLGLDQGCSHPLEEKMGEAFEELTEALKKAKSEKEAKENIIEAVCDYFETTPEKVLDVKRGRSPTQRGQDTTHSALEAFKWICYFEYTMTEKTYSEVAMKLDIGDSTARKKKYSADDEPEEKKEEIKQHIYSFP